MPGLTGVVVAAPRPVVAGAVRRVPGVTGRTTLAGVLCLERAFDMHLSRSLIACDADTIRAQGLQQVRHLEAVLGRAVPLIQVPA